MKLKIITGFSEDEKFTIEAEEAHKAYYLFNNPDKRGTFSNGVAIVGKNINSIKPDYHATMGWNPTHRIDDGDWNEIRGKGLDIKFQKLIALASDVAKLSEKNTEMLNLSLKDINNSLLENPINDMAKQLVDKLKK